MVNFTEMYAVFLENSSADYLVALGVFVGLFVTFQVVHMVTVRHAHKLTKKTATHWDDMIIGFLSGIGSFFYVFVALYVAVFTLTVPALVSMFLNVLLIIFVGYYVARGIGSVTDTVIARHVTHKRKEEDLANISLLRLLGLFVKITVWVVIVLMVLSNLGIAITPLVASLGIGGIAIALALQTVLGDLFSAVAIYFDKPFKEGDFIIVGSDMGVVKHIGIKTTRIESLGGQELVISNSELTSTRINNYKRMQKRRVAFEFGIEYGTPNAKIKKVREFVESIVKEINTSRKHTRGITLDRVHFKNFGESSLNFEVVYYVPTADYNAYMDIQEQMNLGLKERFEKANINFAFPSRTVYLEEV